MQFASPLPWWLVVLVAAGLAGAAYLSYRRPAVPLTRLQRGTLISLRVLVLGTIVFFLCRPVVLLPPAADGAVVVPILVDASRSMQIEDADGQSRMARARQLLREDLLPALSTRFSTEVFALGETLVPSAVDQLAANERRSNLSAAVAAARERYRSRRVAGIVVLSDGGETGDALAMESPRADVPPVFAIGIGSREVRDREVVGLTAGDPRLDEALVDLHVSAVSHGFGRAPFEMKVLANGRLLETRRVTPATDGSPIDEVFTVSPDPVTATVYTVEIGAEPSELAAENNARSVLVNPIGRKRRVLAILGAPGYEHSFLTRALSRDPGLELDVVVRKGRNDAGEYTFFIQAGGRRAAALNAGFPATREALYLYDAVIVANVEADFFSRAQLELAADFVGDRGGGLLVFGWRSFERRGFMNTALEPVLPLELDDRRGGLARATFGVDRSAPHNTVVLTPEGETHPVLRIAPSQAENYRRWSELPPLAATATLGGPRPGATVLAVAPTPSGAVYPLIAVQRYGRGRAMLFGGEATWRWRMMLPSTDRTHEFFWRQTARWLATATPDPMTITFPEAAEPGDDLEIAVDVRDAAFAPSPDATVDATIAEPGGEPRTLTLRRDPSTPGRFTTTFEPGRAGLYRLRGEARQGTTVLGTADRWFHVGGADREFADPRLNETVLRRVAAASQGRYVPAAESSAVLSWLTAVVPSTIEPERRDLWHHPWSFAFVIGLLAAEWLLRRRWGLR